MNMAKSRHRSTSREMGPCHGKIVVRPCKCLSPAAQVDAGGLTISCRQCQRIPACRQIRRNVAVLLMLLGVSAPGVRAAVINVTTTIQKVSTSGGCSLQEAICAANLRTNSAIDYVNRDGTDHFITTQCAPGTGNDTIA